MANTTEPLPPMPPPQPGDVNSNLPDPGETAIQGFRYGVGPIPAPPSFVSILRAGIHYEYAVAKRIYVFSGLKCSPVCGVPGTPGTPPVYLIPNDPTSTLLNPGTPAVPGTPMSVTRETAPWGTMTVFWQSSRRNGNPVIPSQDLGDPNVVFKEGYIDVQGPGYMADGTKSITRVGVYCYWLRVPYTETDTILAAAYPDADELLTTNSLVPANFSTLIAGPNRPPAGAPTNKITF